MQQGDGYWGVLQTLLAIVLVAIGLRFAACRDCGAPWAR